MLSELERARSRGLVAGSGARRAASGCVCVCVYYVRVEFCGLRVGCVCEQ